MATPDCTPYRDEIVAHFLAQTPLPAELREHYAGCAHCIAAVTRGLSRGVTTETDHILEAAWRALEHGQRVLEREFGIKAPPAESR
jgi:hypothetical protein